MTYMKYRLYSQIENFTWCLQIGKVDGNQKKDELGQDRETNQKRKSQIDAEKQTRNEDEQKEKMKKQEIEQLKENLLLCMEEMRYWNEHKFSTIFFLYISCIDYCNADFIRLAE